MKLTKKLSLFLFATLALASCQSSKSLQNKLQIHRADLDYELTSAVYPGKAGKTVHLNFIGNSNMEYFTTVKNSKVQVLPFILYNYWHKKFNVVLGEQSLTQPYREFLTDALLAECNRSSCFNLAKDENTAPPDYQLEIKILDNQTLSGLKNVHMFFIFPMPSAAGYFSTSEYKLLPVSSRLEIAVTLKKASQTLFHKEYKTQTQLQDKIVLLFDTPTNACISQMTACLSATTKQIVEDISNDLNFIMLAQQ